jgi:hypothetical protein
MGGSITCYVELGAVSILIERVERLETQDVQRELMSCVAVFGVLLFEGVESATRNAGLCDHFSAIRRRCYKAINRERTHVAVNSAA